MLPVVGGAWQNAVYRITLLDHEQKELSIRVREDYDEEGYRRKDDDFELTAEFAGVLEDQEENRVMENHSEDYYGWKDNFENMLSTMKEEGCTQAYFAF